MPVWSCSTPEKFLVHVQQAIAAIKAKGLQKAYERLVWPEKECNEKLKEVVLNHDLPGIDGRGMTQSSPRLLTRPRRLKSRQKV